jgi:mercuric ion transport protein
MNARSTQIHDALPAHDASRGANWLAAGGLFGGMLAASCCVVPLALVSLGVSGAWIGQLSELKPLQPAFAAGALVFLGAGFWRVYRAKPKTCAEESYCARPQSKTLTQVALWLGAAFVAVALTVDLWAPLFY